MPRPSWIWGPRSARPGTRIVRPAPGSPAAPHGPKATCIFIRSILPKQAKPVRTGTAWLVRGDQGVWLRQRPDKGLLGGMMEVPSSDWSEAAQDAEPPFRAEWVDRGEIRHVFTHFELRLQVKEATADGHWRPNDGVWVAEGDLEQAALPSVMRKVIAAAGRPRRAGPGPLARLPAWRRTAPAGPGVWRRRRPCRHPGRPVRRNRRHWLSGQ